MHILRIHRKTVLPSYSAKYVNVIDNGKQYSCETDELKIPGSRWKKL